MRRTRTARCWTWLDGRHGLEHREYPGVDRREGCSGLHRGPLLVARPIGRSRSVDPTTALAPRRGRAEPFGTAPPPSGPRSGHPLARRRSAVNARNTTNPSSSANPVESIPKTPDARSPSEKYEPSGARRRTSNIAATVIAVTHDQDECCRETRHRRFPIKLDTS